MLYAYYANVKNEWSNFLAPVKINNIVKIYENVLSIGNWSISISLEVRRFSLYIQEEQLVLSTRLLVWIIDE